MRMSKEEVGVISKEEWRASIIVRREERVKQTGRQFGDELLGWANYLFTGSDSTRWRMQRMPGAHRALGPYIPYV